MFTFNAIARQSINAHCPNWDLSGISASPLGIRAPATSTEAGSYPTYRHTSTEAGTYPTYRLTSTEAGTYPTYRLTSTEAGTYPTCKRMCFLLQVL